MFAYKECGYIWTLTHKLIILCMITYMIKLKFKLFIRVMISDYNQSTQAASKMGQNIQQWAK